METQKLRPNVDVKSALKKTLSSATIVDDKAFKNWMMCILIFQFYQSVQAYVSMA